MQKWCASVLAVLLAAVSVSALACPGDKAKDEGKQMSTPDKPKG